MRVQLIDPNGHKCSPILTARQLEIFARENQFVASPISGQACLRDRDFKIMHILPERIAQAVTARRIAASGRGTPIIVPAR
jgi:hypothetical protein